MLALMNHEIDVLVLCQSLNEEERRGILVTAHALQPGIKCATLTYIGADLEVDGVDVCHRLDGPRGLLLANRKNAIEGRIHANADVALATFT